MKKLLVMLLALLVSVLVSCDPGPDVDPSETKTDVQTDTESAGDVFTEGLIVGQDEGYSGVPCADDNQKMEKYVVHFWYTLDPDYVYRDASITVSVRLTFHNEDGTTAAEQTAAYTLRYDENGQLIGEEPTVDEYGSKTIVREIVLEEANQACFFMDTDVDFELVCAGTVFAR